MEDRTFDAKFRKSIVPFIFLLLFILFLPYLFTSYSWFKIDFTDTGQIGDTIGGIIGPFIAIIAAALTFIAFWVQYKANLQQWEAIQIDRLENRINVMLSIHRQNLIEMKFSKTEGRDVFINLFKEFKAIYTALNELLLRFPKIKIKENADKITNIAYIIYMLGINRENRSYLYELILNEIDQFPCDEIFQDFEILLDSSSHISPIGNDEVRLIISEMGLSGHSQMLGHYYRHLYHSVSYIDNYSLIDLSSEIKYGYVKNFRAQLSNYEQLLLHYNALSPFGRAWLKLNSANNFTDSLLIKYKMIKNIPLTLADIGRWPQDIYDKEIKILKSKNPPEELFEWAEIVN